MAKDKVLKGFNEGGLCKCGRCGRKFSGLGYFDMHFMTLDTAPWSVCMDPGSLVDRHGVSRGLRLVDGVWKGPKLETEFWAKREK